jgi:hypothetical protein
MDWLTWVPLSESFRDDWRKACAWKGCVGWKPDAFAAFTAALEWIPIERKDLDPREIPAYHQVLRSIPSGTAESCDCAELAAASEYSVSG